MSNVNCVVDELENDGLRYTESVSAGPVPLRRVCDLFLPEPRKRVATLATVSFTARFGRGSVAVEGFAGVATESEHQGKGFGTRIMERSLRSMSERVDVAFLYGIEGFYRRFGFSTCLAENRFSLWIGRTAELTIPPGWVVGRATEDDIPDLMRLFNETNRDRPWSRVRDESAFSGGRRTSDGNRMRQFLTIRDPERLRAYAVLPIIEYGHVRGDFTVQEAAATDGPSALAVLAELGRLCRARDREEFSVSGPPDSPVGLAARRLGCVTSSTTTPDGEGMAAILNRERLVGSLEDELMRRVESAHRAYGAQTDGAAVVSVIRRIAVGELIPDDTDLIRGLLGYEAYVSTENDAEAPFLRAMFPGGGCPWLQIPHSYPADRF